MYKFKGYSPTLHKWVYGSLLDEEKAIIVDWDTRDKYTVYPFTVGQLIASTDCEGNELYVGDVVEDTVGRFTIEKEMLLDVFPGAKFVGNVFDGVVKSLYKAENTGRDTDIVRFRGYSSLLGRYVYGMLIGDDEICLGGAKRGDIVKVDPASVGQYLNYIDKHGECVYEGDIILIGDKKYQAGLNLLYTDISESIEVVGNTYKR